MEIMNWDVCEIVCEFCGNGVQEEGDMMVV